MKWIIVALTWIFACLSPGALAMGDCEKGRLLYEQAREATEPTRKIELLEQARKQCRDFHIFYDLGIAYFNAEMLDDAKLAFKDAFDVSIKNWASSKAMSGLAQVFEASGKKASAVQYYRKSYELHPYPRVLERLEQLESQLTVEGLPVRQIIEALVCRGCKSWGVEPGVNLYIRFRLNSDQLDQAGKKQASALGGALNDPELANKKFLLIGHTDKTGSKAYNQGLSERRARTVKKHLIDNFGLSPLRIRTEGQGESTLLYTGDAKKVHALNRRVEVRIIE